MKTSVGAISNANVSRWSQSTNSDEPGVILAPAWCGEHQPWEPKSPDPCWIEVESQVGHSSRSWRSGFSLTTSCCNKINLVRAVETSWRLREPELFRCCNKNRILSLRPFWVAQWDPVSKELEQTRLKAKHQQKLSDWSPLLNSLAWREIFENRDYLITAKTQETKDRYNPAC